MRYAALLLLVFATAACDSGRPDPGEPVSPGTAASLEVAFQEGTRSEFVEVFRTDFAFDGDTSATVDSATVSYWYEGEEGIPRYPSAFRVVRYDGEDRVGTTWYDASLDTIREVALVEGGAGANLATIYEEPRVPYRLPLRVGARWTESLSPDGVRAERRVVGIREIAVPAGTFEVAVIENWRYFPEGYPTAPDGLETLIHTDYVASFGLVKRSFTRDWTQTGTSIEGLPYYQSASRQTVLVTREE